mmetsp:Transcript_3282/g.7721  ORF Transcript_3282/g.7721 Transcript_3282/m.7721 type:complete len:296 (+) Transcript_3282:412-1299(+)
MFNPDFFGGFFAHFGGGPDGYPPQPGSQRHHRAASGPGGGSGNNSSRPRPDDYIPPASKKAIANLPDVVITKRDLALDENRNCIICFEDQQLSGTAAKLPCGHIFCRECISDWLGKQCTCPVCRFELQTNDTEFEKKRKQTARKARYKASELKRMTAKELKAILATLEVDARGFMEKREFVDAILCCSDKVEVVPESTTLGVNGVDRGDTTAGGSGQEINMGTAAAAAALKDPSLDKYFVEDLETMNLQQLKNTFKLFGLVVPTEEKVTKDELIALLMNSGKMSGSKDRGDEERS